MFKSKYFFDRYLEPGVKKQCKKWCDDFNYAKHALNDIVSIRSEPLKK